MQLILIQDVQHLGKAGDLVTVKSGYGRNYLVPRGFAVSATTRNVKRLEHQKKVIARKVAAERASAQEIAERLNGMTLRFERLVGDDERLFGSVSSKDIASQLDTAGIRVDHRKIKLAEPVKALGKYEVEVKLPAGVVANLKFWVVAKEGE